MFLPPLCFGDHCRILFAANGQTLSRMTLWRRSRAALTACSRISFRFPVKWCSSTVTRSFIKHPINTSPTGASGALSGPAYPVVAMLTSLQGEDSLRQYDAVIDLYDSPTSIIQKMRAALESGQESGRGEGEELSAREKDILICVAKGMLNKEIADLYNISIYTVITHRKNITRKTGIKTVAGLTVYALLNNLIDIGSVE